MASRNKVIHSLRRFTFEEMKQGIHIVFRILGFQFKRENESFCFRKERERERERENFDKLK